MVDFEAARPPRPHILGPGTGLSVGMGMGMGMGRGKALALGVFSLAFILLLGLCVGPDGIAWPMAADGLVQPWVLTVRLPRGLGAVLVGALLGLAGALAQGLFRNPLADPYLLGTAAGASLGVVLVLAATTGLAGLGALGNGASGFEGAAPAVANAVSGGSAAWAQGLLLWLGQQLHGPQLNLVVAAFAGALAGMGLTLSLARGAGHSQRLLLAGIAVGIVLMAISDALLLAAPQALRGKQVFLLGSTSFLGPAQAVWMALVLALCLPLAMALGRALDALGLGEDTATSLGLHVPRTRLLGVVLMALATGAAVAQAGLVAFVGLMAPHVVRRLKPGLAHAPLLLGAALAGAALLGLADVLARLALAPRELPVGLVTAIAGGGYLMFSLWRRPRP